MGTDVDRESIDIPVAACALRVETNASFPLARTPAVTGTSAAAAAVARIYNPVADDRHRRKMRP